MLGWVVKYCYLSLELNHQKHKCDTLWFFLKTHTHTRMHARAHTHADKFFQRLAVFRFLKPCKYFVLIWKHLATFSNDALWDTITSDICWGAILKTPEWGERTRETKHTLLSALCQFSRGCVIEINTGGKKTLVTVALNIFIHFFFSQLSRQNRRSEISSASLTARAPQARVNCCTADFHFPGGNDLGLCSCLQLSEATRNSGGGSGRRGGQRKHETQF